MVNALVKNSGVQGNGDFATKNLKKDEKIFKFSNNLITILHKPGCDCDVCKRCINLKKDKWLYPKKDSLGWNLNHSCNPNSYSKGRDIFALRKIKKGEEITIDYSTTSIDKKWSMRCICGLKNCRKIIRSIQFLPLNLFNRYLVLMPRYVESNYGK